MVLTVWVLIEMLLFMFGILCLGIYDRYPRLLGVVVFFSYVTFNEIFNKKFPPTGEESTNFGWSIAGFMNLEPVVNKFYRIFLPSSINIIIS